MRRLIARFFFVVLLGGLAMILGVVTSLTLTPPGRALLARVVPEALDRVVDGQVRIGGISGSFLYDLTLQDVVIRDTSGVLLASVPRLHFGYRIPNLAANRFVFTGVELDNPVIQVIRHRNGRLNFQDIFRLGRGPGGGRSPLIVLNDVRIRSGLIRVAVPWNPPATATTGPQRDSALAAQRDLPGRVIQTSDEGLQRVYLFQQVTAGLPQLRITTPERLPLQIEIDTLAASVSDPAVQIRDAIGRLRLPSDSLVFSLERAALPNTLLAGGGAVSWPSDTVLFDFQMVIPRLDLQDMRWISPDFPSMRGEVRVTANSVAGGATEYVLRGLHVEDGPQVVEGDLVAITNPVRGVGVRDLDVRLEQLDIDAVRGYVDSLPFEGTVTGTLQASGYLRGGVMDVRLDWDYADAEVEGQPVTSLAGAGQLQFTTDNGLVFRGFDVRRSDIALGTVERIAPAVRLEGRLQAAGTLDGALQDATFEGVLRHTPDADGPVSVAEGSFHLDTRGDVLGLDVDAMLDPLALGGFRPSYPSLPELGELRGRLELHGTLDDLDVNTDLTGEFGRLALSGDVRANAPVFGADSLLATFENLDLRRLTELAPTTDLTGTALVSGLWDTTAAPDGIARLALSGGSIREFAFDTLFTRLAVRDSVIVVDTLHGAFLDGLVAGSGTLGWTAPHGGTMTLALRADSLTAFDSLATVLTGMQRGDSGDAARPLGGTAEGDLVLQGSLDSLLADLDLVARDPVFRQYESSEIVGTLEYAGGSMPTVGGALRTDSLSFGSRVLRNLSVAALGRPDSLRWGVGTTVGDLSRFAAEGETWTADSLRYVQVDSLTAQLATHFWTLVSPTTIILGIDPPRFTPLTLTTVDGSGEITVSGDVPGETRPGALDVAASGIALQDVFALLQRDTSRVAGEIAADFHVAGTARDPEITAEVTQSEAQIGDVQVPFLRLTGEYADSLLVADLSLTRAADTVLVGHAELPLDLALNPAGERKLSGRPLAVSAEADSVDFNIIEALTPAVDSVQGILNADVGIAGTWDDPRLEGFAEVLSGAMTVPGIGVRYSSVRGGVMLEGDSLVMQNVLLASNGGQLEVDGFVRLEELTAPVLRLTARARNFHAIDVPQFLDLTVTGDIALNGPLYGAVLTGRVTADQGVLYFADLLNKNVINLDDPANFDVADTLLIRQRGLQGEFQSRFLNALQIDNLAVTLQDDFWLRSGEANIQIAGRAVADKVRDEYLVSGTLNALRGTYTLKIGPVTRDFTVQRGTITYFGTPDLNAELDIRAQHIVQSAEGDIPIIAIIEGTLLQPRLTLTSSNQWQALAEVDLVSYLMFGVPSSEAALLGRAGTALAAAGYLTSAFTAELERALITDLGLPVDLIEIRPAIAAGGARTGLEVTQLVVGWQFGRKVFLTVNAGVCGNEVGSFGTENVGAALQLRFSNEWRSQLSLEPTFRACRLQGVSNPFGRGRAEYQIGGDLLYEKEF